MILGRFIESSTVTGTQIRLDNNQYLRARNFANTSDVNILKVTTSNLIEFKSTPYVETQGRLALYSEIETIQTEVEYLYGQLTEVTDDISAIQGDIVDIQNEIDDIQNEVLNFALKDLSNLTPTAIPVGVNLESVNTSQVSSTSFRIKTLDQTISNSGRIELRSGIITSSGTSNYSSGAVQVTSGSNNNANAVVGNVSTGGVSLNSGAITGGSSGNTGTASVSTGGITATLPYLGSTGSSFLQTGFISASANSSGSSGNIILNTGILNPSLGVTQTGSTGLVNITSGQLGTPGSSNNGKVVGSTGFITIASGSSFGVTNEGQTGSVNIQTGSNLGIGFSGNVRIRSGSSENSIVAPSSSSSGYVFLNTGKSRAASSGTLSLFTGIISPSRTQVPNFGTYNEDLNFDNSANLSSGTGNISLFTGYIQSSLNNQNTGTFLIQTGSTDGLGATGPIQIFTGNQTNIGNSGDINIFTGSVNSGNRGYVSIDGSYISVNSKQIKNLADGTDPTDAVNLSQLDTAVSEVQSFYGSFYSTQTQTNLVPDIARAMTFNSVDEAYGVSIVSASQITFSEPGIYNIQFSAQLSNANGSKQEVDIWLSKNGTNVPFTNSQEKISGLVDSISAWNFFIRVTAGDYCELYWSSPSNDVSILYTGAKTGPDRPETPSIILTVNRISI